MIKADKTFYQNFLDLLLNWLIDDIFKIRVATCDVICLILKIQRFEAVETALLKRLEEMSSSESYLIRGTCVCFINVFFLKQKYFNIFSAESFFSSILVNLLKSLTYDNIENVRIACLPVWKSLSQSKQIGNLNIDDFLNTLLSKDNNILVKQIINEVKLISL